MVRKEVTEKHLGHLVGRPYIASLWLRFLRCDSRLKGFFALLPGFVLHVARLALNSVNKRVSLLFTHPFSCLKGVSAIWGICVSYFMDPIQIIAKIHYKSWPLGELGRFWHCFWHVCIWPLFVIGFVTAAKHSWVVQVSAKNKNYFLI